MRSILNIKSPTGQEWQVAIGNNATFGRTKTCEVCLEGDARVSRQHAIVRTYDGCQYQIVDLGSKNGTYVNGKRLVIPCVLSPSDEIRIGDFSVSFAEGGALMPSEAAAATLADDANGSIMLVDVALLVIDIRGFTRMNERMAPPEMAQFLGTWFKKVNEAVYGLQGVIDKYLGDAVFAYWANGSPREDCECALGAAKTILKTAAQLLWPDRTPFEVVAALHYGRVTCGMMGDGEARNATIIGDAVNTVFRLEGLTKALGARCVISADLKNHLTGGENLTDCGAHPVKGRAQMVHVYSVTP